MEITKTCNIKTTPTQVIIQQRSCAFYLILPRKPRDHREAMSRGNSPRPNNAWAPQANAGNFARNNTGF
jgi:hypothetical protein